MFKDRLKIPNFLVLVSLLMCVHTLNDTSCATQTTFGCESCPAASYITFNTASQLYTCIPQQNCFQVNTNKTCTSCISGFTLKNLKCYKSITNCLSYTINASTFQCTQCVYPFMSLIDCTVPSIYCQSFDYVTGLCNVCNQTGEFLDQSKQFCRKQIEHCMIYSFDGCAQCDQQYVVNVGNNSQCIVSYTIEYQLVTTSGNVETICLQNNFYFNTTLARCIEAPSVFVISGVSKTFHECQTFNTTTNQCDKCIAGSYLVNGQCNSCKIISNCLTCELNCTTISSCQPNCSICQPTHFPFLSQGQFICRQCSTYGCHKCISDSTQNVKCTQCQRGKTLINNTCYSCPQSFELSLLTLQCIACPINCANCSNGKCMWCAQNYTRDASSNCILISTFYSPFSITNPITMYEILSKSFPNQQNIIYNNEVQLMSSCQGQASKYSCICGSNSSMSVSSMCYNLTEASKFDISKVFPAPISIEKFLTELETLRLMSQLPAFETLNFNPDFTARLLLPENKLASLLQIYTEVLRRQNPFPISSTSNQRLLAVNSSIFSKLFIMVEYSLKQSFSISQTTIIYGNGYYMKYYPVGDKVVDTDGSFVSISTRNHSQSLIVFVWFDNLNTSKSLTGTIYAYSSSSYPLTISIQQTTYPLTTISSILYQNGLRSSSSLQKTSTNTLTFTMSTSTSSPQIINSYNVIYAQTSSTDINNLFSNQRIQFIFYQPAFIYVLVFLVAYLFLIPCCALLDFISPKRAQHRKRVRSEDLSLNPDGKPQNSQDNTSQSRQTIQISVNYKDFFPIYNICNTPRPKRILKLCLFLLNMQHGITFLTLIYFNLQPDHPVIAVVLGVPAYFCTIIMGYICGVLTIVIPGWFKYLINLIVLGYWILWVALMPRFQSQEYQPYVFIFAIVFFVIDLIIDCLEMFMVYFSIIKSQRQTKMFECLAAWLSKRGYYEYDQLANQMNDGEE